MDQAQIDKLKETHGELYLLTAALPEGELALVCRKPNLAALGRFYDQRTRDLLLACGNLLAACVLVPAPAEFKKICDESPGLYNNLAGELLGLVGGTAEVVAKKL